MTPEGRVKARIRKYLDEQGLWYFCPQTGGFGRSGIPDFIVCWHGRLIGIEAKKKGGKPTDLQKREIDGINRAGGYAFVYDGVSELATFFEAVRVMVNTDALERAVRLVKGGEDDGT